MRPLDLARPGENLLVLCLGAHCDDIEIGAGGTLLAWIDAGVRVRVHWCVLSAFGPRAAEAQASASAFLAGAADCKIELAQFRDSFFPHQGSDIKTWIEKLKHRVDPDVILTHRRDDAHQDHRELCLSTWNTFRNHLILEYEIPKWDGDLGQPNVYVSLSAKLLERKIELLLAHFVSQRSKDWFDAETFRGLARLRGMECRSPDRYAEAFVLRKGQLG
jgi:LmbE family N-acetylglucosaminyl deacetylase